MDTNKHELGMRTCGQLLTSACQTNYIRYSLQMNRPNLTVAAAHLIRS